MRQYDQGVLVNPPLDTVDCQLLEALQVDCKTSLTKLGSQVGLSAPAVMERVRKLEGSGVITGYHAQVDARRVGLDITSFIGVSINYPKDIDRFVEELSNRPEIQECHHVTGGHTLLVKVKTRNTKSLEHLISGLRAVPGVTRTETMVVLSTKTERTRVPLPKAAADFERRPRRAKKRAG